MKTIIRKTKTELKAQSKTIRQLKNKRKSCPNGYVSGLLSAQWHYRHKHVAYCLVRGRTMEQIEPNVRAGNELSESLLESYTKEYTNEVVHTCV